MQFDILISDLRFAFRIFMKYPVASMVSIILLGGGFAVNIVMYSVLWAVLLRPLPFENPQALVQIWRTDASNNERRGVLSPWSFGEWQSAKPKGTVAIASYEFGNVVMTGDAEPERLNVSYVSASFFNVFGIAPLKGRMFDQGDAESRAKVVVLSFSSWQRYFSGVPDVNGKTVTLDGASYQVVGVMPSDFDFPSRSTQAWLLKTYDLSNISRNSHFLFGVARLRPGTTVVQAQSEMSAIAGRLSSQPSSDQTNGIRLVRLDEEITGGIRDQLITIACCAVAVLLIICGNVAGLLLAQVLSREGELALRLGLGATRWRIARQFVTEALVLSSASALVGITLAWWLGKSVLTASSGMIPRLHSMRFGWTVMVLTVASCVGAGIACSVGPLLHLFRLDMWRSLKGEKTSKRPGHWNFGAASVVGQIALSLMLMIVSMRLTVTLWELQSTDPGFEAKGLVTMRFSPPRAMPLDPQQRRQLYAGILQQLSHIPGVRFAATANNIPFGGSRNRTAVTIVGRNTGIRFSTDYRVVSATYFEAMKMRLISGRLFTSDDRDGTELTAVVNQTFSRQFSPNSDPLSLLLRMNDRVFRVVGVVSDARFDSLSAPAPPEVYTNIAQVEPSPSTFFVVRAERNPELIENAVRAAVNSVIHDVPVFDLETMEDRTSDSVGVQRLVALLLVIFGVCGLALAMLGIYALFAQTVAETTRDIGIRIALGSGRGRVLGMILRRATALGIAGIMCGVAFALAVMRTVASSLLVVRTGGFAITAVCAIAMWLVVLLASYIPARKASAIDPLQAIRAGG